MPGSHHCSGRNSGPHSRVGRPYLASDHPHHGRRGSWSPVVTSVTCEDQKHFLISGGVKKQHRNLSPEADCVKCPVSQLQSPDSGHYYWCHLSLVFTLFYKHRNKSQLVSPHIRHIPVFTTLTPPSVFPALPRFPPCLLTPPWPPCPDWPGLVSTCGPLSAPGPLLSDWSPRPRCWPLIGPA